MTSPRALLALGLVVAAYLCGITAPSAGAADIHLNGKLNQRFLRNPVHMQVGPDGRVRSATVHWSATCRGAPVRFHTATALKPKPHGAPGTVRTRGTYRLHQKAYSFRVKVSFVGKELPFKNPGEVPQYVGWRGRFAATVVIRKGGNRFATCRTPKGLTWGANSPGVPEPLVAGTGSLVVTSGPGNPLTDGHDWNLTAPPITVDAEGDHRNLSFGTVGAGGEWSFRFRTFGGAVFQPGTLYDEDAIGVSADSVNGHRCDQGASRVALSSIAFDHYNRLLGFDLTLDLECHYPEGSSGSTGLIAHMTYSATGFEAAPPEHYPDP
jgi:hypothetical protein